MRGLYRGEFKLRYAGRGLMRRGYVALPRANKPRSNRTRGMAVLRARTPITLTKPIVLPKARRAKRAEFGETFAAAIAEYLQTNPRQAFD